MTTQRKNDAALIIRQNNDIGVLTIIDADEAAAELLGETQEALRNKPFLTILGQRSIEYLSDSVGYDEDSADLHEACLKLRDMRLKYNDGKEFTSSFRLDRMDSPDGHGWFRLVFPSEHQRQLRDTLAGYLKEHFAGASSTDPDTGLPTSASAFEYAGMLKNTLPANDLDGVCALLRIDRYEKSFSRYGKKGLTELVMHVANCCKSTFRSEDVICQINDHTLAMFLVDINHDAARIVLNRLRWNIRNHRIFFGGKEDFSVTVSISFGSVLASGDSMLNRCQGMLDELAPDERNLLVEVNG